ncbi:MAG: DUF624 domain-containing protein [Paenibacillaceae bacterium]
MEMNGLMGGLYRVAEWIMRLAVINLLWLFCSIPFIILIVNQFLSTSVEAGMALESLYDLIFWMLPPLIIAPFCFLPASAALYTVARKWVMGDEDVPLFKTFFRGFKSNYKQSMLGGLFFSFILIVLLINVQFYSDKGSFISVISYLFIVMVLLLIVAVMNYLSMLSHFEMKTRTLIKNSILFTIGRPLTSLMLLVGNFVVLYVSFYKITFLIPFFMGSLMGAFSFWSFYKVLRRMQEKGEQQISKEA